MTIEQKIAYQISTKEPLIMKKLPSLSVISMSFVLILASGCKKENPAFLPVLTTNEISSIAYNSATSGGSITSDGGSTIVARGVCWSSSANPKISNNKTSDGRGIGSFRSSITGLSAETTYYVRAYATNSDGTAYGSAYQFKTLTKPDNLPVLSTIKVYSITFNSAKSGGNITSDGGSTIVARGVCWSSTANPTIANNKTSDGAGIGSFTSSITGLSADSTYYVRAYATNSDGTGYGNSSVYYFTASISKALIPAGTFTMGSPESEVSRSSDETQHVVTLSAFRMSKYEITNAQYAAFLNTKSIGRGGLYAAGAYPTEPLIYENSDFGLHYSGSQWLPVAGYEASPVIYVTWYGAAEFAAYLGGRLPTEAQWEYACRAGTTTPFSTGTCLTNQQANYDWGAPYGTCTNTETTSPGKPQPVGSYAANAYGLYDMHGNVWEWCADWYGAYPTLAQTNSTGAATGSARVIRGGSWDYLAEGCRSAFRTGNGPDYFNYHIGFRVVFVP